MAKRSPFPRKPASKRPPNQDRGVGSPLGLDFAIKFQMLTDEEIKACQTGRAYLHTNTLQYYNRTDGIHLYKDRRLDILADRILGLDKDD